MLYLAILQRVNPDVLSPIGGLADARYCLALFREREKDCRFPRNSPFPRLPFPRNGIPLYCLILGRLNLNRRRRDQASR